MYNDDLLLLYHRVAEILDYTADELTGMNMYTLCHGEDVGKLRKCHLDRKYIYYDMHALYNVTAINFIILYYNTIWSLL